MISRKDFLKGLTLASVGACGISGVLLQGCGERPPEPPGELDALQSKTLDELRQFTGWLEREGVAGYIGEMNWPNDIERPFDDASQWNALGEKWFREADKHDLWVTGWNANDWGLGASGYFFIYGIAGEDAPRVLTTRYSQADVFESHQSTPGYERGVNLLSGYLYYSVPGFCNENPGRYGEDYYYMGQRSLDYLADRGVTLIRFPFRWERLQRTLGGELDATGLQHISEFVDRAARSGLKVILDVHNFGGYFLYDTQIGAGIERKIGGVASDGTMNVTPAHLADLWTRLSAVFQEEPTVVAYDIMNEPKDLPAYEGKEPQVFWEEMSQDVLHAIRDQEGEGPHKLVMIPGYQTSAVRDWITYHPDKWIQDPADNYRYEAHHYFGKYSENSYSDLLELAERERQRG